MIREFLFTAVICLFGAHPLLAQNNSTGTLEIKFTGIRSDIGDIAIGINSQAEGFPSKPQIELQWKKLNIVGGEFTVKVPDLPHGTLAVSALDDVNGNQEMEMFLGIPREGFGFSMDPPFKLSAPKFNDCSFPHNKALTRIEIRLKYIGKDK